CGRKPRWAYSPPCCVNPPPLSPERLPRRPRLCHSGHSVALLVLSGLNQSMGNHARPAGKCQAGAIFVAALTSGDARAVGAALSRERWETMKGARVSEDKAAAILTAL